MNHHIPCDSQHGDQQVVSNTPLPQKLWTRAHRWRRGPGLGCAPQPQDAFLASGVALRASCYAASISYQCHSECMKQMRKTYQRQPRKRAYVEALGEFLVDTQERWVSIVIFLLRVFIKQFSLQGAHGGGIVSRPYWLLGQAAVGIAWWPPDLPGRSEHRERACGNNYQCVPHLPHLYCFCHSRSTAGCNRAADKMLDLVASVSGNGARTHATLNSTKTWGNKP